jgi:exonuclease SbcC
MKLQTLIIHNIASIEDATIDFEAKPLSDSEVFLITGKTGSGKSTILDAICLALYATTPRLKNTNIQGDTDDADSQMKVDDPRQLLRRNTGEGFVRLTFIGSNGVNYQAEWAVMRARKKPTGKLQRKSWSITNLQTNKTLTKDGEIKVEIAAAIGLDFNQFCRTTILAQGEFTRFLNSDDDSKATILEKITGVDAYSKIGAKVYAVTAQHKADYDAARQKLEGVEIFSDEKVTQLKADVATLRENVAKVTEQRSAEDAKLRWINDLAKLSAGIEKARSAFESTSAQLASDEYRDQLATIDDWNATLDARKLQADIREARQLEEDMSRKMDSLFSQFEELQAGIDWQESELDRLNNDFKTISETVANQSDCNKVYSNTQSILAKVNIADDAAAKAAQLAEGIRRDSELMTGSLKADCNKAVLAEAAAKADFDVADESLKAKVAELDALAAADLRSRREACLTTVNDIKFARVKIDALVAETARINAVRDSLGKLFAETGKRKTEYDELTKHLRDTETRRDAFQRLYDAQMQTVDEWAKEARRKLKIGDRCPVCGQTVETELPHDDELISLCQTTEAEFVKERDEAERIRMTLNTLDAQIKVSQEQYDKGLTDITNSEVKQRLQTEVDEACAKLNIKYVENVTAEALDKLEQVTVQQIAALDESLKAAAAVEVSITEARKALEQRRKAWELAKNTLTAAEKKLDECRVNIEHSKSQQADRLKDAGEAAEAVAQFVSDTRWLTVWQERRIDFAAELRSATEAYTKQQADLQAKQQALTDCRTALEQQLATKQSILSLMGDHVALSLVIPAPVNNLLTKLTTLYGDIKSTQDSIAQAADRKNKAGAGLNEFFEQHTEISAERLMRLSSFSVEAIEKLRARLEQVRNKSLAAKTSLDELQKQLDEHNAARPELTDDDNVETLKTRMAELDAKIAEAREKIGALNRDLQQDKENKHSRGELIAEIDRLRQIYERWSRLNEMIGSREGHTFRKIAQSYVLGSLIHCANGYMRTLTDRYTLTVAPGTFVISLQDAYQDYVTRAATTISGGESFLVSLSLALALADIGQQLSVDTMFIDEGFGTLSGEPLRCAVDTLRSLHSKAGRHVGIISHIEELQDRIPVQIQVDQQGNSSGSTITVTTL